MNEQPKKYHASSFHTRMNVCDFSSLAFTGPIKESINRPRSIKFRQVSLFIAAVMVGYAIASSVALLNPATSCLTAFGGGGC